MTCSPEFVPFMMRAFLLRSKPGGRDSQEKCNFEGGPFYGAGHSETLHVFDEEKETIFLCYKNTLPETHFFTFLMVFFGFLFSPLVFY